MSFFEVEFPRNIGYKRLGAPVGFNTTVNQGLSGQEQRNRNWANSRGKWTIDLQTPTPLQYGGTRQNFIDLLNSFMLVTGGRADAFRLFDHVDNTATGQTIGVGNGTTTVFQLTRTYTIGGRSYVRNITKPITASVTNYQGAALTNTVLVYLNGVLQSSGWTVDYTTGLVTFGSAPTSGVAITASCQYHYPVRFDSDNLELQIEASNVRGGQPLVGIHSLQLQEVPPPNY